PMYLNSVASLPPQACVTAAFQYSIYGNSCRGGTNAATAAGGFAGAGKPPRARNPGGFNDVPVTGLNNICGDKKVPKVPTLLRASYVIPKPPRTTVCDNGLGDHARPTRGSRFQLSVRMFPKLMVPGTLRPDKCT